MKTPLLEVRNLKKTFPIRAAGGQIEDFVAVDDLSFLLQRGGSLGIVGESGSGKTTTARMIAGLQTATSGSVIFEGRPFGAPKTLLDRRTRARQIQMVFQDPFGSLDPRQKLGSALEEILALHYRESSDWRVKRANELLDHVGLSKAFRDRVPRSLSGGQRQRFAIAKALALEPQLLILDECVSALDVSVQAQVLNLLCDLRAELGVSYLFVSHDLAVVRQICDDCLVMRYGRLEEAGPTSQILDFPTHDYTKELLSAVPRQGWKPVRRSIKMPA